ncbi:MAG: hypothetical protein IPP82_06300 [Xanthomonadales bacterium]|nr:hypothetical protein [Xanthomonadales bacterium]
MSNDTEKQRQIEPQFLDRHVCDEMVRLSDNRDISLPSVAWPQPDPVARRRDPNARFAGLASGKPWIPRNGH